MREQPRDRQLGGGLAASLGPGSEPLNDFELGVGHALANHRHVAGACPGPLFALLGSGVTTMAVAIASAMLGTWTYGRMRHRLPH